MRAYSLVYSGQFLDPRFAEESSWPRIRSYSGSFAYSGQFLDPGLAEKSWWMQARNLAKCSLFFFGGRGLPYIFLYVCM